MTALEFNSTGLTLATGQADGLVNLYDLRSPLPYLKKDQGYGFPIKKLLFLNPPALDPKVLSADKRIIKIWDMEGTAWTSMEPTVDINEVAWFKDSGMIVTANEGKEQHTFFCPQLGQAPRWCSFLDNLVEEMANDPEEKRGVYDDFKFLTMPQLKALSLSHLVGTTNLLRPYMHGYFVAQKLYEEARMITNPTVWEEERTRRIKDKIDKERQSRIRGDKVEKIRVNKKLAEKVLSKRPESKAILEDDRFAAVFQDEEYAVDETSREFKMLNPSTTVATPVAQQGSASEGEGEDNDEIRRQPEMKISTSSYKRTKKPKESLVGEKEMRFMPGMKGKERGQKEKRKERRSASSNAMRALGR
jgi:ribosome biogenesis protein ENP2